ncbi:unnamed protein product [Mucor hiemalis]
MGCISLLCFFSFLFFSPLLFSFFVIHLVMLKIFGTGKKKRPNHHKLKPGDIKIPIPMVNGVQYANMTESQISTLIGGGNSSGEPQMKKSVSSISSKRADNIDNKTQPTMQSASVFPTRSISSPPVLLMPKPVHTVPPTRFILRSHDYEKTQVESSEDEDTESSDEDDIIELFPSNPVHKMGPTLISDTTQRKKEEPPLIKQRISEEREEDVTSTTETTVRSPPDKNIYHQSVASVTRTSDDSIRQYISASESPFFTTSSVSNMNNFPNNQVAAFPSSPLTTSSPITPLSAPTKHQHQSSFVSARSFHSSDLANALSPETSRDEQPAPPPFNDLPHEETPPPTQQREKTPVRYHNRAHSSSPPMTSMATTSKQLKVTRPASSSDSSATVGIVGHDVVTPTTQSRLTNNNDKPPGTQLSSEQPALSQNNNNILELLETTTGGHSVAISTMQKQQMTLTDDLEELKRTVDRMQQQRVSDREEHLSRVKEQKLREKEILEQIHLTKQKLEMAIAGKLSADDLHNMNDADNNALSASLSRGNEMDHLKQQQIHQQQQQQLPPQQQQQFHQQPQQHQLHQQPQQQQQQAHQQPQQPQQHQAHQQQQEPPMMKASISASSSKSRNKDPSSKQPRQQQQPGRSKNRKSGSSSSLPRLNNNGDPYFSTESYFPDMGNTDLDYMNNFSNQFFQPPKFRGGVPPGGIPNNRGFYPDMENYDQGFDSPRSRSSRHQPRRQRSKSVESQWRAQQEFMDPPPQGYDLFDPPMDDYRYSAPQTPRTRSRKPSIHSARSDLSGEGGGPVASDLHSGYHSAAEEEEDRAHPEVPTQGYDAVHDAQPEDPHRRGRRNRHPVPMMYHNAFGPPMMGMDARDRNRPPPYGYNMPPPGGEFYPYMHQRVSPRVMAAEQQQWPGGPHWGPPPPGGAYGMPPSDNNNAAPNDGGQSGRRYPPSASLQQTPQQSQYLPLYADAPHRLYI